MAKANKFELEKSQLAQIQSFEKCELTLPEAKTTQKDVKLQGMDQIEREKQEFISKMMNKKVTTVEVHREEERKEWIKTSFWAPDNTPKIAEETVKAPPKEMYCPAIPVEDKDKSHHIRMKDLISLKLDENDLHEYVCWTCQKALVH